MRHLRTGVFLLVLVFAAAASAWARGPVAASDLLDTRITKRGDYSIFIDGRETRPDVPPVEKDGIVFIPIRFAAEALRAEVTWDPASRSVGVRRGGHTLLMRVGGTQVRVDDAVKSLVSAPFIYEQRTMIPLRVTAQALDFAVKDGPGTAMLESAEFRALPAGAPPQAVPEGAGQGELPRLDFIAVYRAEQKKDPVTRAIRPWALAAWVVVSLFWLLQVIRWLVGGRENGFKDKFVIAVIIGFVAPVVFLFTISTVWALIVAVGTALVGLFSTEEYEDKLVTMGSVAQGFGLIMTLLGLGLVIGPAIAEHDIAKIGFGIYVKIEPTITGLSLSILLATLTGYEARKNRGT